MFAHIDTFLATNKEKIVYFLNKGKSFEEWFNWELGYMFSLEGYKVDFRPSYSRFESSLENKFGDLYIESQFKKCMIEVKTFHENTSKGLYDKAIKDREKLNTICDKTISKGQLLLIGSTTNKISSEDWQDYLKEKLPFRQNPAIEKTYDIGFGEIKLEYYEWK